MLRWRADHGTWRMVAGAGIPPDMLGKIGTAPGTRESLDGAARGTRNDVRLTLPILIAGALTPVDAEVSVRGRTAIALMALPGHADPGLSRPN
jgi:hypothetical protein